MVDWMGRKEATMYRANLHEITQQQQQQQQPLSESNEYFTLILLANHTKMQVYTSKIKR